jgi:hypothetical protein
MLTPEVPSERENKVSCSDIEKDLSGRIGVNPETSCSVYVNLICGLSFLDTRYVLSLRCFVKCRLLSLEARLCL